MKKPAMKVYALGVCFVCTAFSVIFVVSAIYSGVEIVYPGFTMPTSQYRFYQSDDSFLERKIELLPAKRAKFYENMTRQQLTDARTRAFLSALDNERRGGQQGLLRSLIVLVILLLTFVAHWKLAKKRDSDTQVDATS